MNKYNISFFFEDNNQKSIEVEAENEEEALQIAQNLLLTESDNVTNTVIGYL